MEIQSVRHNEQNGFDAVIDGVPHFVPEASGNRYYEAILEWVAEGGVIEPAPEPPVVVPQVVSRFQARAVLHLAGLLEQVELIMADPETDMLAKLAWSDAQEFRRDSPTLLALSATLGLTDAQLDDLFIQAATIEA